MIIPKKLIDVASLVLSDGGKVRVEFTIACGGDGLYYGMIERDYILCKKTEKVSTFQRALSDLFNLCYNEIGDENG